MAVVLATAVLAAVLAVVLGALFSTDAAMSAAEVPAATRVTVVRGGESLVDVARRTAPGTDPSAVVERIRAANALSSGGVPAGRPLLVPADEGLPAVAARGHA